MKLYNVLFYLLVSSVGVKAVVFPPSRFPFEGKMATQDIPQFITITFDDGMTVEKYVSFKKYLLDIKDSRGCPPRTTHFTSFDWTICDGVRFLHASGTVEQGHHTGPHAGRPNATQIKDAMDQLVGCGVPASAITGFRTPYLNYDSTTLVNLKQLGIVYDTTITQYDDVESGYGTQNTWPFTLENGFTGSIKCGLTGSCINQSYPDMWEIPMYRWYDKDNRLLYDIMDYGTFATDVQQMFERRYNGNRAPFGIYLHEPWLRENSTINGALNGDVLKLWIEHIMRTYTDVYFVTNMDLLEWMQNPVPKSQYVPKPCKTQAEMFSCLPPAPSFKCAGWGQFFNFTTCKCDCTEGFCPINGGPSNGGTCTNLNCQTPPTNQTSGCCSYDFKSCVDWDGCGVSESTCLTCGSKSDSTKWLANGALAGSTCLEKWKGYGCTSDSVCCPGLVCVPDPGGYKACLSPPVTVPTPQVPTAPVPLPTPQVPTAPVPVPTPQVPTAPVPIPTPQVPTAPVPIPTPQVPTAPVPIPTPQVPTAPVPAPTPQVPTAPVPLPTPQVPTAPVPLPTPPVATAPVPLPTPPVSTPLAPVPTPIPLGGQCGTARGGVQLGLNCVSNAYCVWGTRTRQTCRSCTRAPLNAFDCRNYKVACGATPISGICTGIRTLRGVHAAV